MKVNVAMPKISEKELQSQICQWLRLNGWYVLEFGKPGGHRALAGAVPPGCPDLWAIKYGVSTWCEIKTPMGKLSPAQERAHAELQANGAIVVVLRSLEDALEMHRGCGFAVWVGI